MAKKKARAKRSAAGKSAQNQAVLHQAAIKIGTALGKATNAARAVGESAPQTKKEFAQMRKSLSGIVREIERATDRVKKALR
jgi:hypothetical protein